MIMTMTCKNCATTILPTKTHCQRHQGLARKSQKKVHVKRTPSRFGADGKPRAGGGLSYGRAERKAKWEKTQKWEKEGQPLLMGLFAILAIAL